MVEPNLEIDTIGGYCPVQAEGTVFGKPFYFRARGQTWSFAWGDDPLDDAPQYYVVRRYSSEPFAAGWMEEDEARGFIDSAVEHLAAAVAAFPLMLASTS